MLDYSKDITISGGNFTVNMGNSRGNSALKELQKASASSAFPDSSARFDPPKCHPNTRVAILEYLTEWIFGRTDPEALILWLYGSAGAGKSAILQTIAERCCELKIPLAGFFFGRSDPTRNTFKPLLATIAYQIATTIPEIKPILANIIECDPLIFGKSIDTQLQSLIVEPLKGLAASGFFKNSSNWPWLLILIDGLDECDNPNVQKTILRVFATALRDHQLPLIFLIASRPEQHITFTFNSRPLTGLWRSLVLDASFKPDDDIRLFLTESFQEIKLTHPHYNLIPEAWPEPSNIDKLVQKSSGQFIYSSVVIKYVSAPDDRPPRRLEVIMGLRPALGDVPFAELDALYMHILGCCTKWDTVLSILGLVMMDVIHADFIEAILGLEPGDVEIALAPLTSIINMEDNYDADSVIISLSHASFRDFLVDISRSKQFYINTTTFNEHLIPKSINKLMNPYAITGHNQPKVFLGPLSDLFGTFQMFRRHIPWTETVKSALKGFSLQQFWSVWSIKPYGLSHDVVGRAYMVYKFLNFLSGKCKEDFDSNEDDSDSREDDFRYLPSRGLLTIYVAQLSSFESIIQSEIPRYYHDAGLTALVVIVILRVNFGTLSIPNLGDEASCELFRLTEESRQFDKNSLYLLRFCGQDLLVTHYYYLFTEPRKSAEICPDSNKIAQVALRILEYLCDRGSSLPPEDDRHRRNTCNRGLSLLPYILELSANSPELVDFIGRHGKDIVYMPEKTQEAVRAMHEYLDRADEDADMVGQICG